MYEAEFPREGEVVVGVVTSITDIGAFVLLPEYSNREALVLLGELSRKRSRSVNTLTRSGRTEYLQVLRVDKEKGCIDLSKSKVTPEEARECEARFSGAKQIHAILYNVARNRPEPLLFLYETFVWPLYRTGRHALTMFRAAVDDPSIITSLGPLEPSEALLKEIRLRLVRPPSKIRAVFAIHCFAKEGIDSIKDALKRGLEFAKDEKKEVEILLVTHPLFSITTKASSEAEGISFIQRAIEVIKLRIEELKGGLEVRTGAHVVNPQDETEFDAFVEASGRGNREVDGDEDDE